jgi:polysaccharide export outer membrane protein
VKTLQLRIAHGTRGTRTLVKRCARALVGVIAFLAVATFAQAQAARAPTVKEAASARAPQATQDYLLGPGDVIKISVFQNSDLSLQTRVSENGTITYPLIGTVQLGGLSTSAAERRIAQMLREGSFLVDPQVTVLIDQIHGNQVDAIGQFNRPGRYPLETTQTKLSDLIAQAGGISASGSDTVIFAGKRDGHKVWQQIDLGSMFVNNQLEDDFYLQAGDVLFVDRAPVFYIYGEVQHPGTFRVERNMTLLQALAAGGGLTPRGTQKGVRIKRRDVSGKVVEIKPEFDEPVKPEDVIYIRESIF